MKCIVYGCSSQLKVYSKCRISEYTGAEYFFEAASYFRDKVYTRIPDLQTPYILIPADLYVHKNCIRSYEKSMNVPRMTKVNMKHVLFERGVPSIDPLL